MQLVIKKERKEVKHIIQLVSDAIFDAGKLDRHIKRPDSCRRVWDNNRHGELAGVLHKADCDNMKRVVTTWSSTV